MFGRLRGTDSTPADFASIEAELEKTEAEMTGPVAGAVSDKPVTSRSSSGRSITGVTRFASGREASLLLDPQSVDQMADEISTRIAIKMREAEEAAASFFYEGNYQDYICGRIKFADPTPDTQVTGLTSISSLARGKTRLLARRSRWTSR